MPFSSRTRTASPVEKSMVLVWSARSRAYATGGGVLIRRATVGSSPSAR
ncbi:hypothetical protein [Streptomyces sp. SID13726]|nr:hypothetical protein [Streptomyces sp. SID13726]NEB06361.1 hypothetical protein [Streptomyces sp. SID13726]